MRENFPTNKTRGGAFGTGQIGAGHSNSLSKSQSRDGRPYRGPFVSQFDNGFGLQPPFQQRIFVVTHVVSDDEYEIKPRFYDSDTAVWDTDDVPGPYTLDTSEFGIVLAAGDIIAAWFHPQRDAYVPISGGSSKGFVVIFEIIIMLPDIQGLRAANCRVLFKLCGGGTVPDEVGGRIVVLDPMLCIFDEKDEDLIGVRGVAQRMDGVAFVPISSESSFSGSTESGESSSSSPSSSSSSSLSSGSLSGESTSSSSSSAADDNCIWAATNLCCV